MSEPAELCSCEKIFEFWCGCWHATHDLIATDAGKHHAISLRGQAHAELGRSAATVARSLFKAITRRFGRWFGFGLFFRILRSDIDMPAGTATLFFDFGEIGTLVPVGFGVVVH